MSVKDLAELLAHEKVRLKFVFLLEQHIPKFVKVGVLFQSQFLCAPGPTSLCLFAVIHHVTCEFL